MWFVYIVRCADNTLYTGITTDIARRVREHNREQVGSKYTRAKRPVTLVYHESVSNRSEALKREAAIKKLSKQQKEYLTKTH
jgi:putative endonuclease